MPVKRLEELRREFGVENRDQKKTLKDVVGGR